MIRFNKVHLPKLALNKMLKPLITIGALSMSAQAVAGTFTNNSITISDPTAGAIADYTYKFTTQTLVPDGQYLLYIIKPTGFIQPELDDCSKITITIDGSSVACYAEWTNSEGRNKLVKVAQDVLPGSNVELTVHGVTNASTVGNHTYHWVHSANLAGNAIDSWSPGKPIVTLVSANVPPQWQHSGTATFNVAENSTTVGALVATDADGDTVVYSVNGGVDASLFSITPVSGNLTFTQELDFEVPSDSDTDGVYQVTIDATANGQTISTPVEVTLTNVNEAPTAEPVTAEFTTEASISLTLGAIDPEASAVTYNLDMPSNGTLSGTAPNLTYTPAADFSGRDNFLYTVTDAEGVKSTPAMVAISGPARLEYPWSARSAQNEQGELFLGGKYIELGISSWGDFGTENAHPDGFFGTDSFEGRCCGSINNKSIGMSHDPDGFGQGLDLRMDYYLPGTPEERFAVGFKDSSGQHVKSNAANMGSKSMTTTVENTSKGGQLRAEIKSTWTDKMSIKQVISFAENDKFFRNEVTISNISSENWTSARYMRTLDPDNTRDLRGEFSTDIEVMNTFDVDGKSIIRAQTYGNYDPVYKKIGSKMPIVFYSKDSRAKASTFGFKNTDPYAPEAYDSAPAKGTKIVDDQAITITFEAGALKQGTSAKFVYYTSLDERDFDEVIEDIVTTEKPDDAKPTPNEPVVVADLLKINGKPTDVTLADTLFSFTPTLTNSDDDEVTFTIINKPSWAKFDTATGALTGTPNIGQIGVYKDIIIIVEDASGNYDKLGPFDIAVNHTNAAPTISGSPANSVGEGQPYSFTPAVNDSDLPFDTHLFTVSNLPSWAVFDLATGSISGIPAFNDSGIYSDISITVTDDAGEIATLAAFSITVVDTNIKPFITSGSEFSIYGSGQIATLAARDDDGDTLTYTLTGVDASFFSLDPVTGKLAFVSNSSTGADSNGDNRYEITLTVDDGRGGIVTQNIVVAVVSVVPESVSDSYTLAEGDLLTVNSKNGVLANDSDLNGETLTANIVSQPVHGNLTLNADGSFIYRHDGSDTITDSFTYKANDGVNNSATATVTLNIVAVNDSPTALAQTITVNEDASVAVVLGGTDIDGTIASYKVGAASNGTISGTAPNIIYTPNADFNGADSFAFTVTDNAGATSVAATVAITVNSVNDLPVAAAQDVSVQEDNTLTITLSANDIDGTIAGYKVGAARNGTIFGTAPNIIYTPNADFNGADSFIFTVTDNAGAASVAATVAITVNSVNDLPVAAAQNVSVQEDNTLTITLSANDIDGTIASYNVTVPSDGKLMGTAPDLMYMPNENFNGTDSFTFTVTDNQGGVSAPAQVNIDVGGINDLPTAFGQAIMLDEDSVAGIKLIANDEDGKIVSYNLSTPVNGTITGTAPNVLYTPNTDFFGSDSFTFTVTDNESGVSELATVELTINPINDVPEALDDTFVFDKNAQNLYVLDVLSNDTDVEGEQLTIVSASADIGVPEIIDGKLHFTAPDGYIGELNLTYLVTDGHSDAVRVSVTLTIKGNHDESAPKIKLPDDVFINATALYTKVNLGVATAVDANGNPLPVSLIHDNVMFPPGTSKAYWQAEDADGNKTISAQNVHVNPLISIGKDQTVVEGNQVTVNFYLNGPSPVYPVVVPFNVSGSALESEDHDLYSGEVSIGKTNTASITFETFDDGIADSAETIIIELDESVNISPQSKQVITISEDNIAPQVMLSVTQAGEQRKLLSQASGNAQVIATISEPNVQDEHTVVWSSTSEALNDVVADQTTTAITLDVSQLLVGIHKLSVTVTDSGEPVLTTVADIYVEVVASLDVLTDNDTDQDLIPDIQEGFGDSDADGIADYLDAINDCNVMPETLETQVSFLVEGESGVCLRKGSTLSNTDSGSLLLTTEETIAAVGEDTEVHFSGGIFDFIVYGLERPGQEYKLVLPQRLPIPANAFYRKHTKANGWTNFSIDEYNKVFSTLGEPGFCPPPGSELWQEGLTEGHWCVQLQIVDGGPNDSDGIANSTIEDPSGVAIARNANSFPVANNDTVSTLWNQYVEVDVLGNDTDADGDMLTVLSASADFGIVEVLYGDRIHYQPAADFIGKASITYVVSDGNNGTASANVVVEVKGNTSPVAHNDSASTDDKTAIYIDVLKNDTDADGDVLLLVTAHATYGEVTIVDNKLHYTPKVGVSVTDSVSYTMTDNKGATVTGVLSVQVTAYEKVTVTNESKGSGGASAWLSIMLLPLLIARKVKGKVRLQAVMLIAALASLPASAQWGIKASAGQSSANISKNELVKQLPASDITVTQLDRTDFAYALDVYYNIDENLSFNFGFHELGEFSAEISAMTLDKGEFQQKASNLVPVAASGFTAGIGYNYVIDTEWFLSAQLGAFVWENKNSSQNPVTIEYDDNGTDLYYSFDINYKIQSDISIGLGYSHYSLPRNDVNVVGVLVDVAF